MELKNDSTSSISSCYIANDSLAGSSKIGNSLKSGKQITFYHCQKEQILYRRSRSFWKNELSYLQILHILLSKYLESQNQDLKE